MNKNHLAQTDMETGSRGGRGWGREEGRGAVAPEVGDLSIESREKGRVSGRAGKKNHPVFQHLQENGCYWCVGWWLLWARHGDLWRWNQREGGW